MGKKKFFFDNLQKKLFHVNINVEMIENKYNKVTNDKETNNSKKQTFLSLLGKTMIMKNVCSNCSYFLYFRYNFLKSFY